MPNTTLIAAIFSLALTLGVIWANPYRFSNWAFALVSFVQTIWLACVYRAMKWKHVSMAATGTELEMWLRTNAAVIAFLPATLWFLKNAILDGKAKTRAVKSALPLLGLAIIAANVCYSDAFIFRDADRIIQRGPLYYAYSISALVAYVIFLFQVGSQLRNFEGIRRVELQFLALTAGGAALLIGILNILGNYFQLRSLNGAGVVVLFVASALTALALLFHKVFNAREVVLRSLQRSIFILLLSAGTFLLWRATHVFLAQPFDLLLSIGTCSLVAVWFDRKSRDWFERADQRKLAAMRQAAIEIGGLEIDPEKLAFRFEGLFRSACHVQAAHLLFDTGPAYAGGAIALSKASAEYNALIAFGWTTPESLIRRRSTPALKSLHDFQVQNSIGLVLCVPRDSPAPSLILTLGKRVDEAPFTYPEIERLQGFADLINNIVTRSRLASQAALKARIEYLGIASRGLAHDLKNLITPVSSYLVHTDQLFSSTSAECEVHDAAFKATRTIAEYVRENLFFSEQLSPLLEPVHVEQLCTASADCIIGRAKARDIQITTEIDTNTTIVADRVLLQRVLVNLICNAIDASNGGQTVRLAAKTASSGCLRLEVVDQGCGIPEESLACIFDPYFTTKEFGETTRGMGLGLTIVQRIVHLHHGRISVKSQYGQGTTFTIDLPREQTPAAIASASNSSP